MERARQGKFRGGDEVFYGGITYCRVSIFSLHDGKPYKVATLRGMRGGGIFFGSLAYAYPTLAEYEASGVHWNGPPKLRKWRR